MDNDIDSTISLIEISLMGSAAEVRGLSIRAGHFIVSRAVRKFRLVYTVIMGLGLYLNKNQTMIAINTKNLRNLVIFMSIFAQINDN